MCAWLAAAAPYVAAAGTVVSVVQQQNAGKQAQLNADFEAAQYEKQANAELAVSQQDAVRARRESRYLQSRAQAVAAASGAGATDPTVVNLIGDLEEEGEYNALTALYNGSQRAEAARSGATITRQRGKAYRNAAKTNSFATVIDGASSMARYG
jgi:hypothetical protein